MSLAAVEATPRVVLDTNVCLDLLVFADPRCDVLLAMLRSGAVIAMTNDACREEWKRVLSYPQLQLDAVARESAMAGFDALMQPWSPHAALTAKLPSCRDPDDQKFLELAADTGARWLLSRDEHLLALARRMKRDGWFEILTPQAWLDIHRPVFP